MKKSDSNIKEMRILCGSTKRQPCVLIKRTPEEVIRLTVPAHEVVARGTLRNIIKQANLTREEFIKLSKE